MFCTYLTIYSGNRLPPFYIGYTFVDKIKAGYRGSVRSKLYRPVWEEELQTNPHLFKTKILKIYESIDDAKSAEERLQTAVSVHKNPMYINLNISGTRFGRPKGIPCSDTTKQRISAAKSGKSIKKGRVPGFGGKKHSLETLQKLRVPRGPWDSERIAAKSEEMKRKVEQGKCYLPSTLGMKYSIERVQCPKCTRLLAKNKLTNHKCLP